MNGNSDPNFNEAGTTGAHAESSSYGSSSAAYGYTAGQQPGGQYPSEGNYTAPGANYGNPAGDPYAAPGYVPPPPGYAPPYGPPPPPPGAPNPGLATLLGFIPGVGAMYNGQFAKGIAHIVIFSILTSLSSHAHDPLDMIFGLLTAGWYFYMVFDSYQTARARRDGLVAPDPFGLNTIGERFGMPANPSWGDFVARAPGSNTAAGGNGATTDSARTSNPYAGPPTEAPYGAGAPPYGYAQPMPGANPGYAYPVNLAGAPYGAVPPVSYPAGTVPPPWHPDYAEAMRRQAAYAGGSVPSADYQPVSYPPVDPAAVPPYSQPTSRIPTGAIWLIGLGVLALAGTIGHSFYWTGRYFGGIVPIVLGAGLIVQRALAAKKFYPEGSAAHQWYILHQSRAGLLLIVVGVLTLLSSLGVLSWNHSWPYLLILFGLLQVADRAAYNRMLAETPLPYEVPYGSADARAAKPTSSTETANNSDGTEVR